MVARPLARYLLDRCGFQVAMADLDVGRAGAIVAAHPLGRALSCDARDVDSVDRLVADAELVVSLLPPALHPGVARACLRHRRSLVTTSYVSAEMQALDGEARARGVLLLNEVGEDPGLDHMGARSLIAAAAAAGARVVGLRSYGAGLPVLDDSPNPVGYKLSWSPRGVLLAARNPAVYLDRGRVVEVPAAAVFDAPERLVIAGVGVFEAYPNRDCLRYREAFGLPEDGSLLRGLLRHPGWCETMRAFIALGLLDDERVHDRSGRTCLEQVAAAAGVEPTVEGIAAHLGVDPGSPLVERLRWLGLLDRTPAPTGVDLLLELMLRRLSYGPGERDMVIVHNEITVVLDGARERRGSTLVLVGEPSGQGDTAMSRAVSWPAAVAARLILEGRVGLTGVRLPVAPELYEPVLAELEGMGLAFRERE
jgi:saccharopine dehydrogenase-like NADP-dependent oxidoreductase